MAPSKSKESSRHESKKEVKAGRVSKAKVSSEKKTSKREPPKSYPKDIPPGVFKNPIEIPYEEIEFTAKAPTRNSKGQLVFENYPDFKPNMTPKEVLQAGSFGGTYFRPIKSSVTGKKYTGVWKELPKDWLEGLNVGKQVSSSVYDEKVNTYGVKCGGSLEMWEESQWIHPQDPYGWFMWYCRFYQGRRSDDDDRQIGRWLLCAGDTGRWRNNLIVKCVKSGCAFDNKGVSPVVRQTLQHWGYKLTKEDHDAYVKKKKL